MSEKVQAQIICDGCGESRKSRVEDRSTHAISVLCELWSILKESGWLKVRRGYHPHGHYCPRCADKPMKPIPNKKRAR